MPEFIPDRKHFPTSSAPVADDGNVRVALFFDNPGTRLSFVLGWQPMSPPPGRSADDWMAIRNPKATHKSSIWEISATFLETVTIDGEKFTGTIDQIVDHFGERLIFGSVVMADIQGRLDGFFGEQEGGSMTAMDKLYTILRLAGFLNGKLVKKAV